MRQLEPYPLWIGNSTEARDIRRILAAGIGAIIDLALSEPPIAVTREVVYCRFPLVDGVGNPPWLVRVAVETTASLIRAKVPTLSCCGAGMSRSPAVTAAALALAERRDPAECLELIAGLGGMDVSPGFWREVLGVMEARDR
ncbi:MAG TPA: hypothetical protein VIL46_15405 [Gemmataceae bacterium]